MRPAFVVALLVSAFALVRPSHSDVATTPPVLRDGPRVAIVESDGVLFSNATIRHLLHRESAGPDTFDLYGGPARRLRDPDGLPDTGDEYVEGRFEDLSGNRPRGLSASPEDWTGVDRTDEVGAWQVATFNAANLNGNGTGNRALWSGFDADAPETVGWSAAPGYGNGWNDVLLYESAPLADPSTGQTVSLDFVFNHDVEAGFDFLHVEYDSAGTWVGVASVSGANRDPVTGDFPVPGVRFSDVASRAIFFAGKDYGGPDGDRIRIRLRVETDGARSDEDGLFDGDGAVQIDDVVLRTSQGRFGEDFEGPGPYLFAPAPDPICGDFALVLGLARDVDPCATNLTPQLAFVDRGQEVPNGPGENGESSTGGSVSERWGYAVPGGYVVNHSGGLDGVRLDAAVRSPAVDWDLPGALDDGPDVVGAFLAYDVYRHNPLVYAIFFNWGVRSKVDGAWGAWRNRAAAYYSDDAEYVRFQHDVTDLIPVGVEQVQVRFQCYDWSILFGFPGVDATPAPFFDDVRLAKYRVGGIHLSTRTMDLANDAFPADGGIDAGTPVARDRLDVRFDMARDVNGRGDVNVPGDSVVFAAHPVIPGTSIADLRMKWALRLNPTFEGPFRAPPARAADRNVVTGGVVNGADVWTGEVLADSARSPDGVARAGSFFVDLPDVDFLYPGDVLHYHLEATDSDGRVTTLPTDVSGFGEWDANGRSAYERTWTMRALPTITDASGTQPPVLVHDDSGREGSAGFFVPALAQLGLVEGVHYDTFTTQAAQWGLSNGLASAGAVTPLGDRRGHGATVEQLAGYSAILYFAGDRSSRLLSDGSNDREDDKSPDLQLLTAWKDLPGSRGIAHFGDAVASAVAGDSPQVGAAYVAGSMGVRLVGPDVGPRIGGQTAPMVQAVDPTAEAFVVLGGCPESRTFDHVEAAPGATRSHGFVDPATGAPFAAIAAGVSHVRTVDGGRKVDLTFPFALPTVVDAVSREVPSIGVRTRFLGTVLNALGAPTTPTDPVAVPVRREPSLTIGPNPFNPSATVVFVLPAAGVEACVEVFDVRGQRVRVLFDGTASAAELRLRWDGRDDRGNRVASGVYLARATTEGFTGTRKAVLVK